MSPAMRKLDRVGEKVGRLTVLKKDGTKTYKSGQVRSLWLCECECGNLLHVSARALQEKCVLSCGCLQKERAKDSNTTHGKSYHQLYKVWTSMKQRCENPKDRQYSLYGARGISVCDRWSKSFQDFLSDVEPRPDGHSLDRINNDGNYSPENVRWATGSEQLANTRRTRKVVIQGKQMCLREVSSQYGIAYSTLLQRLKAGLSVDEAVSKPIDVRYKRR